MRHFMLVVALGIFAFGFYLLLHLGAFKPVMLSEERRGPLRMIYLDRVGSYHKMAETIVQVEDWAKAQNVDCKLSFGEYIDDPNIVEEVRLHSRGGCLVAEFPQTLGPDFKTAEYPERHYVKAIFNGSPSIGPFKVYGKAEEYIQSHKYKKSGPPIEVYEVQSATEMTTTYLFPVE